MSVKAVVARLLNDELASIGIRTLTTHEAETIANRIFERITDLELELAARDMSITHRPDKPA